MDKVQSNKIINFCNLLAIIRSCKYKNLFNCIYIQNNAGKLVICY